MNATSVKKSVRVHDLVTFKPLARFYFQGDHSHPVRREVLIINEDAHTITGYEIREGNKIRTLRQAIHKVKVYRKDKIACWGDYSRLRMTSKTIFKNPQESTLERFPLVDLFRQPRGTRV